LSHVRSHPSHHSDPANSKSRKYREEFIKHGFVFQVVNGVQHPQCVVCSEVLFFRRKEGELRGQKKLLTTQTTIPTKAQRASYEVAYLIAQTKKPHTIGATLIKPVAIAMSRIMHGDKQAAELQRVPLSDGTVARRISDMALDIKRQLIDAVKGGKYSLQLDESTVVSNSTQLLVFVRYIFEGKLNEEMLFCLPLEGMCTGEDIFNKLDCNLKEEGLSWSECLSVCTDGAGAMLRKKKCLKTRVLQVAPHVIFTHCIIHREALACKTLNPELKHVLYTAIKIDTLIELSSYRALRTRFDSKTLDEFWISVKDEYPQLSKAALNTLMAFGSTYLCEKTFSALTYIKNKHRSRLNVEDDLHVAISKTKPRLDLLCSVHSAHPSH
uniref:HAT C-terminal dimerisation domain-containing protein n=1 Tax=Cyprinus carpio carpio TaxID=630221 RepID=A0A9J8CA12_CYPCA